MRLASKYSVGSKHTMKTGVVLTITRLLEYPYVEVFFERSKTYRVVRKGSVGLREVKDFWYPYVCGVGFLGDFSTCKDINSFRYIKQKWENMLTRCYLESSTNYASYGGKGVYVAKDFHNFTTFYHWYLQEKPEFATSKSQLDKDIIGGGIYSKDTCLIIPARVNAYFKKSIGTMPRGISEKKSGKYYVANYVCYKTGETKHRTLKTCGEALEWLRDTRDVEFIDYCRLCLNSGLITKLAMSAIAKKVLT